MKLTELKPRFGQTNGVRSHVIFDCPKCGKHKIGVPVVPTGEGAYWNMSGNNFDDLTLSPSIAHLTFVYEDIQKDPTKGEKCDSHFFVRNGNIEML